MNKETPTIVEAPVKKFLSTGALANFFRQARDVQRMVRLGKLASFFGARGGVRRGRSSHSASRRFRGRNRVPGKNQPTEMSRLRRFTACTRGMQGIPPRFLEILRAQELARRERKKNWKDPRLQGIAKQLALAA